MRFWIAEDRLRRTVSADDKITGWIMMPAVVLSAFADELFLKCLLLLEGKTPPDIHHLAELFNKLEQTTKDMIEAGWNAAVQANEHEFAENERKLNITIPRDLPTALADCGDTFRLMRYIYDDPLAVKFYIIDLPQVLRDVILARKPEWK
jgi:HEPN domain-containing protein